MDNAALVYGNDYAPIISASQQATVHREDTTPEEINDGTPASPVTSLFQQDLVGLKMTWGLSWAQVRPGVEFLTGVAW